LLPEGLTVQASGVKLRSKSFVEKHAGEKGAEKKRGKILGDVFKKKKRRWPRKSVNGGNVKIQCKNKNRFF